MTREEIEAIQKLAAFRRRFHQTIKRQQKRFHERMVEKYPHEVWGTQLVPHWGDQIK